MNIEELRNYCLEKLAVEECFPFGPETLVYKVNGKIFLLASLDKLPLQFNVKCDAEKAIELREHYPAVIPGYHMNKRLWNTVIIDGSLSSEILHEFIDDSYQLVTKRIKK